MQIILDWQGPFLLTERLTNSTFEKRGLYIFSVEYDSPKSSENGQPQFLVHFTGLTNQTFRKRLRDNENFIRNGEYYILNAADLQRGKRTVLWDWHYKKMDKTAKELFRSRQDELGPAIEDLISAYRIFLAPLNTQDRVLQRLEAEIMRNVYKHTKPVKSIADVGMRLVAKRPGEENLKVQSKPIGLIGIPDSFEA